MVKCPTFDPSLGLDLRVVSSSPMLSLLKTKQTNILECFDFQITANLVLIKKQWGVHRCIFSARRQYLAHRMPSVIPVFV